MPTRPLPAPRALLRHDLARWRMPGGFLEARATGLTPPPERGPVLFLLNRSAATDAALVALAARRPVHVAADAPWLSLPGLAPWAARLALAPVGFADAPARALARVLDREEAVLHYARYAMEPEALMPEPAFLDILLACRFTPVTVVPVLARAEGPRLALGGFGPVAFMREAAGVEHTPDALYARTEIRLGRPVVWGGGAGRTLTEFRLAVGRSLSELV